MKQISAVPDKDMPGCWRVEAIDESSGEIYQALFMGPLAAKRAWKYSALLNAEQEGFSKPITAYMCGTDVRYEMDAPDMLGDCRITPNKEFAERGGDINHPWPCIADEHSCGLAEVEVRFVRWIREPKI